MRDFARNYRGIQGHEIVDGAPRASRARGKLTGKLGLGSVWQAVQTVVPSETCD